MPRLDKLLSLDLDNDQDRELLLHTSAGALLLLNNNQGSYQRINYGATTETSSQLHIANLTAGDQTPDLLVVESGGAIKSLLFTAPLSAPPYTPPPGAGSVSTSQSGGGTTSPWALLALMIITVFALYRIKTKKASN